MQLCNVDLVSQSLMLNTFTSLAKLQSVFIITPQKHQHLVMSRLSATLFKHKLCRKKTVIIGSVNHMAKSMSVLDQDQLLKCFI